MALPNMSRLSALSIGAPTAPPQPGTAPPLPPALRMANDVHEAIIQALIDTSEPLDLCKTVHSWCASSKQTCNESIWRKACVAGLGVPDKDPGAALPPPVEFDLIEAKEYEDTRSTGVMTFAPSSWQELFHSICRGINFLKDKDFPHDLSSEYERRSHHELALVELRFERMNQWTRVDYDKLIDALGLIFWEERDTYFYVPGKDNADLIKQVRGLLYLAVARGAVAGRQRAFNNAGRKLADAAQGHGRYAYAPELDQLQYNGQDATAFDTSLKGSLDRFVAKKGYEYDVNFMPIVPFAWAARNFSWDGMTLLHIAALAGEVETVKMLLEQHRADPNVPIARARVSSKNREVLDNKLLLDVMTSDLPDQFLTKRGVPSRYAGFNLEKLTPAARRAIADLLREHGARL